MMLRLQKKLTKEKFNTTNTFILYREDDFSPIENVRRTLFQPYKDNLTSLRLYITFSGWWHSRKVVVLLSEYSSWGKIYCNMSVFSRKIFKGVDWLTAGQSVTNRNFNGLQPPPLAFFVTHHWTDFIFPRLNRTPELFSVVVVVLWLLLSNAKHKLHDQDNRGREYLTTFKVCSEVQVGLGRVPTKKVGRPLGYGLGKDTGKSGVKKYGHGVTLCSAMRRGKSLSNPNASHRVWGFSYSGLWPFWGPGSVHVNGGRAWSLRKRIQMDLEHDMLQDVLVDTKSLLSVTRTIQALDHPTKVAHSSTAIPQKVHRWSAVKRLTDCSANSQWLNI